MAEELDAGTTDPFESADLQRTLSAMLDNGTGDTDDSADTGATAEDEDTSTETLIDPATLPDELKPHWSRMTQTHNRRLNEIKAREHGLDALESKAETMDRFETDPAFAREVITNMATRLGLSLGSSESPTSGTRQPAGSAPSQDIMALAQQELADQPDLQFLAPAIAKVANAIMQKHVEPLQEQQVQRQAEQRQAEYEQMAATLTDATPGWEEHEDEMLNRLNFLKRAVAGQGPMSHPRYGSVLAMLHQWTTGNAQATAAAGRRMQHALQGRTTTGTASRSPQPSVHEQISKADTADQKWEIAFRDAVREVSRTG